MHLAISRIDDPEAMPREISSRSARVRTRRERRRAMGGMPPRGNNTERMQLCGLSKARPISCSDCPAFQRLQTSHFSIAESPNRLPGLMSTPPLKSRLTSDGVASTYRMHPNYRTDLAPVNSNQSSATNKLLGGGNFYMEHLMDPLRTPAHVLRHATLKAPPDFGIVAACQISRGARSNCSALGSEESTAQSAHGAEFVSISSADRSVSSESVKRR